MADYRLTINNIGPSDAVNVVVRDILPSNARFVSVNTGTSGFVAALHRLSAPWAGPFPARGPYCRRSIPTRDPRLRVCLR
ncbi:MAG: DUF11 domain-containing protein [Acidobacteria bacterium]|nr:DUF11 domain-containing protein [Acidobacteriota bacterium]